MSLAVRPASLVADRQEIVDLLIRNVACQNHERLFEWRHLMNPMGEAWVWLLCDIKGKAVATASVFPRRMLVNGKELLGGHVGVVAVEAAYRSLGPAVQLQRTTFALVDSGKIAFCYDCPPDEQRMATFRRLGIPANSEIARYAYILRSEEFLEEHIGKGIRSKLLAGPANLFLNTRRAVGRQPGLQIEEFTGRFSDEFSDLDRRASSWQVIRGSRSTELLNWRYRECPGWDNPENKVLVARVRGELVAFVAFWIECSRKRAYISDPFGLQLDTVGAALLGAAIESCRRERVFSLHGYCTSHSELSALFRKAGFRRREKTATVVAYEKPNGAARTSNHGLNWTFTQMDQM